MVDTKKVVTKIIGKPKKTKDTDGDGIIDRLDCQPKNPMRQDKLQTIGGDSLKRFANKKYIY